LPSDETDGLGIFDRFADWVGHQVARAPFFAFCVILVVIWAPSILVLHDVSVWQLIINTATTILTFLLVSLFANTQARADRASQTKLNALARGLAAFFTTMSEELGAPRLADHARELREAVGLEDHTSS
jgi:low affinity Fe/Cu permease